MSAITTADSKSQVKGAATINRRRPSPAAGLKSLVTAMSLVATVGAWSAIGQSGTSATPSTTVASATTGSTSAVTSSAGSTTTRSTTNGIAAVATTRSSR